MSCETVIHDSPCGQESAVCNAQRIIWLHTRMGLNRLPEGSLDKQRAWEFALGELPIFRLEYHMWNGQHANNEPWGSIIEAGVFILLLFFSGDSDPMPRYPLYKCAGSIGRCIHEHPPKTAFLDRADMPAYQTVKTINFHQGNVRFICLP